MREMPALADSFCSQLLTEDAKNEIRACRPLAERYGLVLSEEDIAGLTAARTEALHRSGRVEFSGGILPKLIYAFCDSPYVDRGNFTALLTELQEAFYCFKSDSEDKISDDELIEFMVSVFNGRAQGSVEYLTGTSLEELCRYARSPYDERDADSAGDLF